MYKILINALIVQSVFAVNSNEFRSKKLSPEGSRSRRSNVQYKKTDNLYASLLGEPHEFFESQFSTRIDHFRPLNQQRVNFTFYVNTFHFENNGSLYIYLNDGYENTTEWIEEGLMVDIAKETGAALLTFANRYFGRNRPFDSASFENLELLSSEQILADVAEFIRAARQSIPTAEFSRVILWGCGLGGAIATIARSRYSHLVYASWSSSGIIDSAPYSWGPYDIFASTFDIEDGGRCQELIVDAYEEIASLVLAGQGAELGNRMNLCNPVDTNSAADVASLYEVSIRAVISYTYDFHYDGVLDFCEDMEAIEGEPLDSLGRWLRYEYNDERCFDPSYALAVELFSNPNWDEIGTNTGRRQVAFLQCTQIGSLLVADQYTSLPGAVDFNYHLQKCQDYFGPIFTYATLTDAFYTLRNEFNKVITNVIYTNGNLDPLRYFGRLYDPSGAGNVINIDFASRSSDLSSISADEREPITEAKNTIVEQIIRWSQE